MTLKNIMLSEESRLLFGKREQEIIRKQLAGERLLQWERNILSRSIRKKLKVVGKLAEFKEEFSLEHNADNKKIIEDAKNKILESEWKENIAAIMLFGSFADGTFTKRSDIDLAVVFRKNQGTKEATLFRARLLGRISSKVDLQVFNILPLKIKKEIMEKGVILYQKRFDKKREELKTIKLIEELRSKKEEFGIA